MTTLPIDSIRTDGGTQPRAIIDMVVVEDYAQALGDGAAFPAVTVFHDGSAYWLADGFHRWHAHKALGLAEIDADVQQGTRREAVLYSVGANAAHGLRRSNEDKRRAVLTLLNDEEWSHWADGDIARRCGVTREYVNRMRPKHTCDQVTSSQRTFIHPRTGAPTTMRTGNIGGRPVEHLDNRATWNRSDAYDGPVFDATPSGRISRAVETETVLQRDTSNDWLTHPIFSVLDTIESLPPATEAANRFPWEMANNLSAARVASAIAWLEEFRRAWAKREPDVKRRLEIVLHGEVA